MKRTTKISKVPPSTLSELEADPSQIGYRTVCLEFAVRSLSDDNALEIGWDLLAAMRRLNLVARADGTVVMRRDSGV